jgi:hypothetical protein
MLRQTFHDITRNESLFNTAHKHNNNGKQEYDIVLLAFIYITICSLGYLPAVHLAITKSITNCTV